MPTIKYVLVKLDEVTDKERKTFWTFTNHAEYANFKFLFFFFGPGHEKTKYE